MMKDNRDILSSVLKTAQMGQTGIRSVLKSKPGPQLRRALEDQLKEYNAIETEAHAIAGQRGWMVPELSYGAKVMSDMMTRSMLMYDCSDSKIAGMMIQGNTRGVIKGLKNQHRYHGRDGKIAALSQKLLDCENANIKQMEPFL